MLKTPAIAPPSRFETNFIHGILLAAFIVQANAIYHHGVYGQDFVFHLKWVLQAAAQPFQWMFAWQERTSPPLYHYLVSLLYRACDGIHWVGMTGLVSAGINTLALRLFYATSRLLIANVNLRLALLVLVAFLPVTLIHSVVLAADSLSQLPFFVIVYALVSLSLGRMSAARAFTYVSLASCFAFSTKFVAVSLIPATLCAILVLCYSRLVPWRRGLAFLAVFLALSSAMEYYWFTQNPANITANFSSKVGAQQDQPAKLTLRSLFFFQPGDAYLLDAPTYRTLVRNYPDSPASLHNTNYFSFPGLAIYAIFTDAMNIFQVKGRDSFGYRMTNGQQAMAISVKTGLGIAVAMLLGTAWVSLAAARQAWTQRSPAAAAILCVGLFAAAWLAFIMTLLPLATVGIWFGYWIPRLFIPSIWAIGLLGFYALDQLTVARRGAAVVAGVVLAAMLLQAGLHVTFLWRWVPY